MSVDRVIGIDLGTTNSALAWADPRGPIRIFDVPQLVAAGEPGTQATLPSFLYFPTAAEVESGAARKSGVVREVGAGSGDQQIIVAPAKAGAAGGLRNAAGQDR